MKMYASLIGPLIGLYYPMPNELETDEQRRLAISSSKLKGIWCAFYPEDKVVGMVEKYGGIILPDNMATSLDYDYHTVFGMDLDDG